MNKSSHYQISHINSESNNNKQLNINPNKLTFRMGFTTSQWISSIVVVASIIFYFAARTGLQQNAFLYVFGVALVVLIVGMIFCLLKTSSSWTNVDLSMSRIMKIGRREEMPRLRLEIIVWQKLWFFVCYLFHESINQSSISHSLKSLIQTL